MVIEHIEIDKIILEEGVEWKAKISKDKTLQNTNISDKGNNRNGRAPRGSVHHKKRRSQMCNTAM